MKGEVYTMSHVKYGVAEESGDFEKTAAIGDNEQKEQAEKVAVEWSVGRAASAATVTCGGCGAVSLPGRHSCTKTKS